jgi:hypothetical protein
MNARGATPVDKSSGVVRHIDTPGIAGAKPVPLPAGVSIELPGVTPIIPGAGDAPAPVMLFVEPGIAFVVPGFVLVAPALPPAFVADPPPGLPTLPPPDPLLAPAPAPMLTSPPPPPDWLGPGIEPEEQPAKATSSAVEVNSENRTMGLPLVPDFRIVVMGASARWWHHATMRTNFSPIGCF